MDAALNQLDKLSQQIEKLEQELQQKAGRQQSGQYAQEARQLREAASKLKELQEKEQSLDQQRPQGGKLAEKAQPDENQPESQHQITPDKEQNDSGKELGLVLKRLEPTPASRQAGRKR